MEEHQNPHLWRGGCRVPGGSARLGFTLIEMLVVIVMIVILASIMLPQISGTVTRAKVRETANIVAGDLEQAVSLAARLRKPVVLTWSGNQYLVRDRATAPADTVRLRRSLSLRSDLGVSQVQFTPASATIYPNGLVSTALEVVVTSGGYTRSITLSPAGLVRVQ